MKLKLTEPGYVVSGGVHLFVLLLLIVSFAGRPETFDPMQETVPIETVSDSEFNKVMQGDKSAKEVLKDATTKVDKIDPNPDPTPKPVTAQADKTVPTPPPPPVQQPPQPPTPAASAPPPPPPPPPPMAAAEPTPPTPPTPPPVPTPPSRPAPAPPTNVPMPPERVDADAEPIAPKPVPTPPQPPQRVAEAKPILPPKPRPVPKPPRVMPKPDQLAKLLDQDTDQPAEKPLPKAAKAARQQPAPPQPVAPPPAPEQTDEQSHTFDLTDISRLLSHDAPAQKAATGRAPSRVASLGSPTAHDDKMAPSLWGQLDGLMEEQYRQCWSYLGLNPGQKYVPQIRVTYDENGGLASEPVLVNPPTDPSLRSLADSALRAVRRCNPLRIPAQYAPYYDEWKGRVLRFDPQEMAG